MNFGTGQPRGTCRKQFIGTIALPWKLCIIICQPKQASFLCIPFYFSFLKTYWDSLVVFFAVRNPLPLFSQTWRLTPSNIVDFKVYASVLFCKLIKFCKYINKRKNTVCDSTESSFPTPKLVFMHALKIYIGMGRNGTIHTFLKSNKFAQLECFCK